LRTSIIKAIGLPVLAIALTSPYLACNTSKKTAQTPADKPISITLDTVKVVANQGPALYQASEPMINDITHTRLDVRFDWSKSYLYGKATLTIKPHFYPVKNLKLDARGFEIKEISLLKGTAKTPLKYQYDGKTIDITLDKEYNRSETYQVYFDYIAKPDELEKGGSDAITSDKGLYFINPLGTEKNKPQQIWTQGETQANSGLMKR
jgi:aminopeptidase N